jgi:hypothetical protein
VREAFLSARSDALVVSCHVNNSSMSGREHAVQGRKIRSSATPRHRRTPGAYQQGVADLRHGSSMAAQHTARACVCMRSGTVSSVPCRPLGHGGSRDSRSELVDGSVRVLLGFLGLPRLRYFLRAARPDSSEPWGPLLFFCSTASC